MPGDPHPIHINKYFSVAAIIALPASTGGALSQLTSGQIITALLQQNLGLNQVATTPWRLIISKIEVWGPVPASTSTTASSVHIVWQWLGSLPHGQTQSPPSDNTPTMEEIDIGNSRTRAYLSREFDTISKAPGLDQQTTTSTTTVLRYESLGDCLCYVYATLKIDQSVILIPVAFASYGESNYVDNHKRQLEDELRIQNVKRVKDTTLPIVNE